LGELLGRTISVSWDERHLEGKILGPLKGIQERSGLQRIGRGMEKGRGIIHLNLRKGA